MIKRFKRKGASYFACLHHRFYFGSSLAGGSSGWAETVGLNVADTSWASVGERSSWPRIGTAGVS